MFYHKLAMEIKQKPDIGGNIPTTTRQKTNLSSKYANRLRKGVEYFEIRKFNA